MSTSSIRLTNDLSYLPAALAFLRQISEKCGFDNHSQIQIELALEEVITLVMKNAFPNGEHSEFEIQITDDGSGISVAILDQGLPWDLRLESNFQPDADLEHQTGEGLSSFLIEKLTDRFEFINRGRDGKETRFVKFLRTGLVGDGEPTEPESPSSDAKSDQPDLDFDIRLARPEESLDIARTVYDCYGYSYAGDYVYYPERITAMNQNGSLRSAVAVVKDTGEVGGHFALIFRDNLPPEIGVAVTKQKFRGYGFARGLGEFLDGEASKLQHKGLQVKEVTSHPYTQKFCAKLGYVDTGFLLLHSPKSLSFKGIKDELVQRNSDVLGFKYLEQAAPRAPYLPKKHEKILREIYSRLEVPLQESGKPEAPQGETLLEVRVDSIRALSEIQVTRFGEDFSDALKKELRRVRHEEIQVVELYLSLNNPASAACMEQAEALGFFFTAMLPEALGGDALVMQYLNGVQVEYDDLVIDRDETRELLDYIASLDPNNN